MPTSPCRVSFYEYQCCLAAHADFVDTRPVKFDQKRYSLLLTAVASDESRIDCPSVNVQLDRASIYERVYDDFNWKTN